MYRLSLLLPTTRMCRFSSHPALPLASERPHPAIHNFYAAVADSFVSTNAPSVSLCASALARESLFDSLNAHVCFDQRFNSHAVAFRVQDVRQLLLTLQSPATFQALLRVHNDSSSSSPARYAVRIRIHNPDNMIFFICSIQILKFVIGCQCLIQRASGAAPRIVSQCRLPVVRV